MSNPIDQNKHEIQAALDQIDHITAVLEACNLDLTARKKVTDLDYISASLETIHAQLPPPSCSLSNACLPSQRNKTRARRG